MSASAVALMVLSMVAIWGGLIASSIFLARKPEVATWPEGDPDDE